MHTDRVLSLVCRKFDKLKEKLARLKTRRGLKSRVHYRVLHVVYLIYELLRLPVSLSKLSKSGLVDGVCLGKERSVVLPIVNRYYVQ
ncbi:MAG: uncharacterized protein KVP18_002674 [Porospora cf. gigantea A]|uniref:uncharacterized protein n=1 Tax=Porospora cf. gigantea A TaxID=2853593 RepID=UPI00355A3913|nr:MAG: hypothetical protein KVP18_002674 [Porospora cf. gigantea A]